MKIIIKMQKQIIIPKISLFPDKKLNIKMKIIENTLF